MKNKNIIFYSLALCLSLGACKNPPSSELSALPLSKKARAYWLSSGKAELVKYDLTQARYGELHKGYAVLVFVAEPFQPEKQVKADHPDSKSIDVLKINSIKRFTTGIYDYSLMNSSFLPIEAGLGMRPLKLTTSGQDWCGHIWTQINFRNGKFQVEQRSYFEDEGDRNFSLPATLSEEEMWNRIRLHPERLPLGKRRLLPSSVYLRLRHRAFRAYPAELTKRDYSGKEFAGADKIYEIFYPELKRRLRIYYASKFPPQNFWMGRKLQKRLARCGSVVPEFLFLQKLRMAKLPILQFSKKERCNEKPCISAIQASGYKNLTRKMKKNCLQIAGRPC